MSRTRFVLRWARPAAVVAFLTLVLLAPSQPARAQFVSQQVGGIAIDARGIVTKVSVGDAAELLRARKAAFQAVPDDMQGLALRKISLRRLEAAIAEHRENGTPLSDDIEYLAGLQRIQYVFVYPEQNDIVLAGPGEGWRISPDGEIVGQTTNRPVMLLDDLLAALRSTEALAQTGITCSIDPTGDGLARFRQVMSSVTRAPDDPAPLMAMIERAMGRQTINVKGVPETSHFARVLVAADYRMKRLGMGLDEPPIAGLPDFLSMSKVGRTASTMAPRWWLVPDYDSVVTDGNGLVFELTKAGVKAMTEERMLADSGQLNNATRPNPLAQKWADNMTAHYDELSQKESIFGQLRNCMDLAVVAALISHHDLPGRCSWSMSLLLDPELKIKRFHAARSVDTIASVVHKRNGLLISASGGISINPWPTLESPKTDAKLGEVRSEAAARNTSWWWN